MAAPALAQAGTGVVDTTGGAAAGISSGATDGNILILQVLQDGTGSGQVAFDSANSSGCKNLAGTANQATTISTFDVGSAVNARQHLWIGRVNADVAPVLAVSNSGTDDLYLRLYEFSGVNTGTTLAAVIENATAGSTVSTAGTSATIADAGVTTLGADRLALNFVAGNDDNALDAFAGMSGGTWAEAVAEFASATGTDGVIGLQTATIASAGTIDGGTDGWADATDGWGVVGFALIPPGAAAVSDPTSWINERRTPRRRSLQRI